MKRIFFPLIFCFILIIFIATDLNAQSRYVDNGDGTVIDTHQKLMWTKNPIIFGQNNWDVSAAKCNDLELSGYTDWRMPTKDELQEHFRVFRLYEDPFDHYALSRYWTSTEEKYQGLMGAYAILLTAGGQKTDLYYKRAEFYVWPVRIFDDSPRVIPGEIIFDENSGDFTVTGLGVGDTKIDFVLKLSFNPEIPDHLHWMLDWESLKLSD